ncbi:hypothetical protein T552_02527 [Pneumocystis carinii B80]|uniref:K Homology domain-containing protein n=1 Tax=Pneumocystis carinii (strain B80) TaxID=1408658 RepID=A0A0W4ZF98_PNEC8|nr:hypothetical protein T552_02527 [Pneumocystis carinii B80]KTW27035.1 hypothetical protein T552_02527 [Pneumocystis carinii B80]
MSSSRHGSRHETSSPDSRFHRDSIREKEGTRRHRYEREEKTSSRRRSASPCGTTEGSVREENLTSRSRLSEEKRAKNPAAIAAAAAARINAMYSNRASVQPSSEPQKPATAPPPAPPVSIVRDVYNQEGDYVKDIEVNDLRNRYTLTKGSTQKMIKEETGADVTTRGKYYPDKGLATERDPPLYLHVTATTKAGLEAAVKKIEELMSHELPSLVDERRYRKKDDVERDELGRRKWPEERLYIGLEPIRGFYLRANIVGPNGQYVKHVQQETKCRVQIKGIGSGFMEPATGRESDEPLYLHITGPDPNEVQRAKSLCEDLLKSVKQQYEQFKASPHSQNFSGYPGSNNAYGTASGYQTPAAPAGPPGVSGSYSADPYAAYGGYEAYVQYYQSYYQHYYQQGNSANPAQQTQNSQQTGNYHTIAPPGT